jgi:predicted nucleic acid-binding Zn ribbon protein
MSGVNEINQPDPSVGVKSPLCHDSPTIACPVCGNNFPPSGRRIYCSDACRALGYRRRRGVGRENITVTTSQPHREITVYECDTCGERSLGEQRCLECHTFMRRIGIGGYCPSCGESVAMSELLDCELTVGS